MMAGVQELRALINAATPSRPWEVYPLTRAGRGYGIGYVTTEGCKEGICEDSFMSVADAALIAGAVNALPELLDEVERLRARIDAVGQVLAESRCECPEGKHGDDSDDIATRGRTFIERLEAGQIPLRDGTDVTKALATAASLLRSCCGALASAERRAEDAGAQAAAWRQHVAALVAAMKTWGSLEDGVPSADDVGEIGDIGRAFDAAHNALRMKLSETTALHGIAEARERLLERELLAIWAAVRPGEPAPRIERDVLHAVEDMQRERDALRAEVERLKARECPKCGGSGGVVVEREK